MKRILIIGNAPLPDENTDSRPAAGLRTWQFLKPLVGGGGLGVKDTAHAFSAVKRPHFKVRLVSIAMPECYGDGEGGEKEVRESDDFVHYRVRKDDPSMMRFIQGVHDEFHPDAIIAVNTFPSWAACELDTRAPIWADLNGWAMAEAQAQAYKIGSNEMIAHYKEMEDSVVARADKISCVSAAQKFAVLGELACIGRLCAESFGYKFTYNIANGTQWFDEEQGEDVAELGGVADDDFVLAWIGGYNTWVDEMTLFKGLEDAMEKCEKLKFVSTGGGLEGLDGGGTFAKFKRMVDGSKFKDRFVFLGWVKTAEIPAIYRRANVGINVDRKCAETYTGARNRINEMMKFGLPVITTLGSEISYEVVRVGAGIGVKSGRHEDLTDAICTMYRGAGGYGENGAKYIEQECNYDYLMKPLLNWLVNPRPAPDRGVVVDFGLMGRVKAGIAYVRGHGVAKFLGKIRQRFLK
ncbi:glycosyltransferase [Patescibacteria group bacterium]|nr:glycosyltransferase [Patescibacteria group bacterium]